MSPTFFSRLFSVLFFLVAIPPESLAEELITENEVTIEGKDFKISIPDGWQVQKNFEGASIFIEAPSTDGSTYRRNMRIMSFSGPVFVDTFSLENIAEKISKGVSESSNTISDYQMTNKMIMDFDSGLSGLLYYGDFSMLGVPMMQMHLVVSAADHHFIVAYTDLKENFDFDNNPYLDQAFATMGSIRIESSAPERFIFIKILGLLAAGLISLGFFIRYMMNRRTKLLTEFFNDTEPDDEILEENSDELYEMQVDRTVEDDLIRSTSGSRKLFSMPSWLRRKVRNDYEQDFDEVEEFNATSGFDDFDSPESERVS